jgi:phosphatidylglycerophosphate synthase
MLERSRAIYIQSKKRNDNFWTEWVSRPPAAVVVAALERTSITPNQVTFASLGVFVAAMALLVATTSHAALFGAFLLMQLSYVLDCADGQLARLKSLASPVGALLDFLMDEVKAFLLVGAATARLWQQEGDATWLVAGLAGLVVVATGITLTSFVRRPEYLAATGAPPVAPATDRGGHAPRAFTAVALVEAAGRFVLHYPSWFLLVAVANRLDLFVFAYLTAHTLYLGRAGLTVLWKLGRATRRAPSVAVEKSAP